MLVFWGQDIMLEIPSLAFMLGGMWGFERILRADKPAWSSVFLWAGFTILALWTKQHTLLILGVYGAGLVTTGRWKLYFNPRVLAGGIAILAGAGAVAAMTLKVGGAAVGVGMGMAVAAAVGRGWAVVVGGVWTATVGSGARVGRETAVGGGVWVAAAAGGSAAMGTAVGASSPPGWVQAASANSRAAPMEDAAVSFKV